MACLLFAADTLILITLKKIKNYYPLLPLQHYTGQYGLRKIESQNLNTGLFFGIDKKYLDLLKKITNLFFNKNKLINKKCKNPEYGLNGCIGYYCFRYRLDKSRLGMYRRIDYRPTDSLQQVDSFCQTIEPFHYCKSRKIHGTNSYSEQNSEQSDECIDFTMMCVLDSEQSDECIDFTMMCGLNIRKTSKKVTEKQEFLCKTSFRQNRFFYMILNFQKLLTLFDVYNSIFYEICRKRENLQRKLEASLQEKFEARLTISRRYLKILPIPIKKILYDLK
ncbi:Uncharacterized protein FWK35_00004153 [Aphis craccivora]|uniref:Uncharacterized protein n=1 Tax=Aphis craccivora TaxID=307492 RepID=A0A6G0Z1J0_APHCR|nr:Uncharacterized protein FWK35_00004153 [Aphis craccivora]